MFYSYNMAVKLVTQYGQKSKKANILDVDLGKHFSLADTPKYEKTQLVMVE